MRRNNYAAHAAAALAALLLCACASDSQRTLVVVVPDSSGRVGKVVVNSGGGETVLDSAYAGARISDGGVETSRLDEASVQAMFGPALQARPDKPVSFMLYFLEGRDEFTAESKQVVDAVFAEIARRKSAEIVVIGHTDRVGSLDHNDALARQRASRVRDDLIARGISANRISVAGRGEREPLIATDDEVAEPRNRRVEISVR